MTAGAHAVIGAAIASQISNPVVGIPLSFLSHFLCDKVPHWDVMTDKTKPKNRIFVETVIDVLGGYALVFLLFVIILKSVDPTYIFLSAFTAQLPDWVEAPYVVLKKNWQFAIDMKHWQSKIHDFGFDSRLKAPWGIVSQVVVVGLFVLWAFHK